MAKTSKKQKTTYFDTEAFLAPIGKQFKKGGKMLANDGVRIDLPDFTKGDAEINRNFLADTRKLSTKPPTLTPTKEMMVSPQQPVKPIKPFGLQEGIVGGLALADMLIPPDPIDPQKVIRPSLVYNEAPLGRGSQAIMDKGGKLTSKKAKEILRDGTVHGKKLTAKQKRYFGYIAGGGVPEAELGLSLSGDPIDPQSINPLKKPGILKWTPDDLSTHESMLDEWRPQYQAMMMGGPEYAAKLQQEEWLKRNPGKTLPTREQSINQYGRIDPQSGDFIPNQNYFKPRRIPSYEHGGKIEQVSDNPFDGGTQLAMGPSHEQGGIDISYGGKRAEVEGGEPMAKDSRGNLNIFGNMIVPGTKKKFKTIAKEIAKEEEKINKRVTKVQKNLKDRDPNDPFDKLAFNSAQVTQEGAMIKLANLAKSKEALASMQDILLLEENQGSFFKGGKIYANKGAKVNPGPYDDLVIKAAEKWGIEPRIFRRMLNQESGGRVKNNKGQVVTSSAGAIGIAQFMPKTAALYGITPEMLRSDKKEDIEKVLDASAHHLSNVRKQYGGDMVLALAAYNGGGGAIEFVKKQLGKKSITGDEWYRFMRERRKTASNDPNAWHNQTFDYVTNIASLSDEDFAKQAPIFRTSYGYNNADEPEVLPYSDPLSTTVPSQGQGQKTNTTGKSRKFAQSTPLEGEFVLPQDGLMDSAANHNRLNPIQIAPEILALATNRVRAVPMQQYDPMLYSPYQVSFEDRLNANNSTLRAVTQKLGFDPASLSQVAAQNYAANSAVLAEEFRTNQGIQNEVTNKNVSLLNEAQFKNLGIADTQMSRQSAARSKTKLQLNVALNSIAGKVLQNDLENVRLRTNEALHDFRYKYDDRGRIVGVHRDPKAGDAAFNFHGATQGRDMSYLGMGNISYDPNSSLSRNFNQKGELRSFTINTPSQTKQIEDFEKRWGWGAWNNRNQRISFNSPRTK